ncbi:MAG: hypothetical protein WD510_01465, partial [Balneolaceae bacterium]
MKYNRLHTGLVAILSVFILTGCYTQLQTVHEHRILSQSETKSSYIESDSDTPEATREKQGDRQPQIPEGEEETYLYGYEDGVEEGYEDGWTDAEEFYFKDYETARWYREHGISLSGSHKFYPHYSHHYDPFFSYFPRYRYPYHRSGWSLSFHFGGWYSWDYYNPRFYHDYYAWHHDPFYRWGYYRYPGYRPYYGYNNFYHGNYYVYFNNYHRTGRVVSDRTYGPRSSGLRNEGVT